MEKLLITIDNRNSRVDEYEYLVSDAGEAAKVLNSVLVSMHRQDTIIGIETR